MLFATGAFAQFQNPVEWSAKVNKSAENVYEVVLSAYIGAIGIYMILGRIKMEAL